jgi:hypothetical protein
MSVTSASAYPLPRPANNADARFSLALALDVADVLTRHGYPALAAGTDLIRLQQALFGLIYHQNDASDQLLDRPSSIGNQIPLSRHCKRPAQLAFFVGTTRYTDHHATRVLARTGVPLAATERSNLRLDHCDRQATYRARRTSKHR